MTRLLELRKRLARLRRRRQRIRWETAYSALGLAVLWVAAGMFLVDWLFELNVIQRGISLALGIGLVVWAFVRWALPWLGKSETDLDMALLVERQEHIDSDLIAAVQFESPEAAGWGSRQLEQAVVDGVARSSPRLNVMSVLSRVELNRRALLLLGTAVVWAGVAVLCQEQVLTFLKRVALGPQHYPTRTTIETLRINRREVDPADPAATKILVTYNQPVRFEITCSGDYPPADAGDDETADRDWNSGVELVGLKSGTRQWLPFAAVEGRAGVFRAQWEGASEPVRFQVFAGWAWAERPWLRPVGLMLGHRRGKAWTDPAPLPVTDPLKIEAELEVAAPEYALQDSGPMRMPSGLRQVSVGEGSRVVIRVFSSKPLKKATAGVGEIDMQTGKPGATRPFAFRRAENEENGDNGKQQDRRERWVLDLPDTPLAAVFKHLEYSIDVLDTDGQMLDEPIEGTIRIRSDDPPRIERVATNTPYVVPTGTPTIYYRARGQYGVARIWATCGVLHEDESSDKAGEYDLYRLRAGEKPRPIVDSDTVLDVAKIKVAGPAEKLVKGDKLVIVLQVEDYRGRHPGKTAAAERLVFQITDKDGIIERVGEHDEKTEQRIQTMIQQQLGIGGEVP
jgi:hypothetical protein